MLALFCIPWAANAQQVVEILGDGGTTTSSYLPAYSYYNNTLSEQIYTAEEVGMAGTITSISFFNGGTEKSPEIKIYMVNTNQSEFASTTSWLTVTESDLVFNGTVTFTVGAWTTIELANPFVYDGNSNLGLIIDEHMQWSSGLACRVFTSTSNCAMYAYSDNTDYNAVGATYTASGRLSVKNQIQLEIIPASGGYCSKPSNVTVTNVNSDNATLNWTMEEGATYSLVMEPLLPMEEGVTSPYTLEGLSPLTTYEVLLFKNCENGLTSDARTVTFTTTAVAEPVGEAWSDDFEGNTCGWDLVNGTLANHWVWGTNTNNGGTHALYIANDAEDTLGYVAGQTKVFATKLLSFTQGKFEFTYDWLCNGESDYDFLRVALVPASQAQTLTAGTDHTTIGTTSLPTGWIALDGGSKLNLQTTWQTSSDAVNVTAGNYYMVLAWRSDVSITHLPPAAVDNVSITKINCAYDVTNVAVSDITTNSANLTWAGGEATQWQVAYSTNASFEDATEVIVSDSSYNMAGLQPSSTYYVKVRAYCGGQDFGSWSEVINFTTACEPFTDYPFTENFDSYTGVTSGTTNNLPICWNYINTCTYSYYQGYPVVYNGSSYSNSGNNHLRFYTSYSTYTSYDPQDQYAILPPMENLNGKQLTLYARGSNANSSFKVGMMTDPTDASTFVEIETTTPTTSYAEYTYTLEGEGNYVAIMVEAANSSATSRTVYIDDIMVADPPTCAKPQGLVVSAVTNHTATLTWVDSVATAWQISLVHGEEETIIDVTENPYTLTGLDASTAYTVMVRANCGNDGMSYWSSAKSFTTQVACSVPTSLTKTEITAHSAKLGWTEAGGATEWVIAYKVTADQEFIEIPVSENPYTLYNLEPSTGYTFKVKAVCGGIDGESNYSTTTTFTTTTECPAPTDLRCEAVTTTTATLSWFGGEDVGWDLLVLQGNDTVAYIFVEPDPTYTVENLLPGTTYSFKVRTFCGEAWSTAQTFTTSFAIPFVEPFAGTSVPTGWTRYSGLLSDVMGGTALSTISSGWNFGTGNGISDNHAKVNIYGTGCKYWLVTPAVLMDENVQLTFDLALTVWSSSSSASPTAGSQADDKFAVLITTNGGASWEVLRQWDNAGSEYVYDNIPNTLTETIIDLSNYSNSEYIAIAFYGESTVEGGDNNLHIDNVKIDYIPACVKPMNLTVSEVTARTATLSWESDGQAWDIYLEEYGDELNGGIQVTENPYTLTNLTPEAPYLVKVRTDCSSDNNGWSDWSNVVEFTTLESCPAPTNVVVSDITGHGATISWRETGTATQWRIYGYQDSFIVDDTTYTFTTLEPETEYLLTVSAVCEEDVDESQEVEFSFTTDVACPAPTDLTYTLLTDGFMMNWNGSSDSYKVQCGYDNPSFLVGADFEDQAIPQICENDTVYPWTIESGNGGYYIKSGNSGESSSTSAISVNMEYPEAGIIAFDAECRGEGTSTYWDHCDFYIDATRVLYAGANISGWNHYEFEVSEGNHTFTWSYTKDGSVNPTGDYFAVDNVVMRSHLNIVWFDSNTVAGNVGVGFELPEAGEYYARVQGNCGEEDGLSAWSELMIVNFTPYTCGIVLNQANDYTWQETFEGITNVTTPFTGVSPACWTLVAQYTGTPDTLPQLYYKPAFNTTEGGAYSLRMKFRYTLAMPVLDESIDFSNLRLSMYVRQPFWSYKLQIGVMTDLEDESTFTPVAIVNNSSKSLTYFECGFATVKDITGPGRYIVFKNIGGTEGDIYCSNYIDDITLTYRNSQECSVYLPYVEDFESEDYLIEPECWDVVAEDAVLESVSSPQLYSNFNTTQGGEYTLRMMNRCVYAMPRLDSEPNDFSANLTMTLNVRQPNSLYRLQIGVWDEEAQEFMPIQTIKCTSTEMEPFTVVIPYENLADGQRIAFRNTLVPGNGMSVDYLDYSYNYIDDINLDFTEVERMNENDAMDADSYLENIAVYPNPTTGNLYIDAVGIQKVECYNQMGQLVRVYDNVLNSIDLNNLSEGVYMLRITVPQGVTMRKVVKR